MDDESGLRLCCGRFRVTSIVILVLQGTFLILFGFHVRYDETLAMPYHTKNLYRSENMTSSSAPIAVSSTSTSPSTQSSSTQILVQSSSSGSDSVVPSSTSVLSSLSSVFMNNSNGSLASSTLSVSNKFSAISPATPGNGNQVAEESTVGQVIETGQIAISVEEKNAHVTEYYAMFQDIHVMMFIGFGFLMTFLKKYGYGSVGFNFLLAAFVLQWATLTGGWILHWDKEKRLMFIDMTTLINADFAAATILISFGAVLGKLSALQLIIMAFIEVVAFQANELFVFKFLKATDVGDSMVVHTFGAYFGLAVAWVNYRREVKEAEDKEGSVYHSDLFSMIGTIFLWLFWPSFNAGTAIDEGRLRAVINTYYSLTASCIVTFAISALVTKDKFNMVHIQNSTLAGGVAVGTLADMIIQPWGAILVGSVAGVVSVLGFRYLTPFLSNRLKLHDTCGVHNLHGMPGLISGIGSILAAGIATEELYGDGLTKIFPEGRPPNELAGYQAAAIFVSLFMGLVCGLITGIVLRIPIWNLPNAEEIFDDEQAWELPRDEMDEILDGKVGHYVPTTTNTSVNSSMEMQQRVQKGL